MHAPASRPRFAPRAIALALAFCTGGVVTWLATAPSALAATVVAGIDGPSWFAHMHGQGHARLHAHVEDMLATAGANDAQKQQIDAIVGGAMQAEHADLRHYHATLRSLEALLAAPRIDDAAVERVRAEQDALFVDTSRRLSETAVQVARVLTPAQRQALRAELDRRMAAGMGHHAVQ